MRLRKLLLALLLCWVNYSAAELHILSYNVENLFYRHNHYWQKIDAISKVVTTSCGWEHPVLVGLQEVEKDSCLRDLCYRMRSMHYRYVHYDSPDKRGIDVALLYDSTRFSVLHSRPVRIPLGHTTTRDLLYVCGVLDDYDNQLGNDTLHLIVCHLPSQLGGKQETQWKRDSAVAKIQGLVDSIGQIVPKAQIIVLGDMNSSPMDNLPSMTNCCLYGPKKGQGTHKYQGIWTFLDQFYVSSSLTGRTSVRVMTDSWLLEEDKKYLDYKPKRSYVGLRWNNGYSDHLPLILTISTSPTYD